MAFTDGECIQDQYGYQYTLTIDEDHQYITGTVSGGQEGRSMDSHGQLCPEWAR